jgi:hypothetical protein
MSALTSKQLKKSGKQPIAILSHHCISTFISGSYDRIEISVNKIKIKR